MGMLRRTPCAIIATRLRRGSAGAPRRALIPTVTPTHIKRYRQALLEAGYKPITIRWKLTIVRRFYEAARNAGLRTDNPAAGVKSPRVRQATEDFKYLCDEELARLLDAIPDARRCSVCATCSWSA